MEEEQFGSVPGQNQFRPVSIDLGPNNSVSLWLHRFLRDFKTRDSRNVVVDLL